ncbi:MAG: hypothetical protein KJ795_07420 [Gammaproteobacteria bacterium]|nr:hypothetical protein [Gammaproteobacteria bacterium]MBU1776409.1 hypothetical protein [Gammaproteobacteria bacterium]MBU1969815.1 hypothetical protein [Gammaproteobacteria bacterium]
MQTRIFIVAAPARQEAAAERNCSGNELVALMVLSDSMPLTLRTGLHQVGEKQVFSGRG